MASGAPGAVRAEGPQGGARAAGARSPRPPGGPSPARPARRPPPGRPSPAGGGSAREGAGLAGRKEGTTPAPPHLPATTWRMRGRVSGDPPAPRCASSRLAGGSQGTRDLDPREIEPPTAAGPWCSRSLTHPFIRSLTRSFILSSPVRGGDLHADTPDFQSGAPPCAPPAWTTEVTQPRYLLTCFGLHFPHPGNGFPNKQYYAPSTQQHGAWCTVPAPDTRIHSSARDVAGPGSMWNAESRGLGMA